MSDDYEIDLTIEAVTGTVYDLCVSPFETILGIKTKIQKLEGTRTFVDLDVCIMVLGTGSLCILSCIIIFTFCKQTMHFASVGSTSIKTFY